MRNACFVFVSAFLFGAYCGARDNPANNAAIQLNFSNYIFQRKWSCGGVFIAPSLILTAKHCADSPTTSMAAVCRKNERKTDRKDLNIFLKKNSNIADAVIDFSKIPEDKRKQIREKINNGANDIALIEKTDADDLAFVQPVKILSVTDIPIDKLHKFISDNKIFGIFPSGGSPPQTHKFVLSKAVVVADDLAVFSNRNGGLVNGISGSGIFAEIKNEIYLLGLAVSIKKEEDHKTLLPFVYAALFGKTNTAFVEETLKKLKMEPKEIIVRLKDLPGG